MEVESSLLELSVAIFLHADLPACVMEPADTSDGVSVSVTKGLSHALNQAGFELGKMLTDYSIKGYIGLYTREVASLSWALAWRAPKREQEAPERWDGGCQV